MTYRTSYHAKAFMRKCIYFLPLICGIHIAVAYGDIWFFLFIRSLASTRLIFIGDMRLVSYLLGNMIFLSYICA